MLKTSSLKQMDDRGHGGMTKSRERSESLLSKKSSSESTSSGETIPRNNRILRKVGSNGSLWGLAVKHAASQRRGIPSYLTYSGSCVNKKQQKEPEKRQNTYKLSPDEEFQPWRVEKVLEDVLECYLKDKKYDAADAGHTTRELCELVKRRVKELNFSRYKLVSQVFVGSLSEQGMEIASRCIWNTETDNFVSKNYKNSSLWAVVTVYGIYLD